MTIFELELTSAIFGFRVDYKKMAVGTQKLTPYVGVRYFMFRQLWFLIEEVNKQKFTCLSFRIPAKLPGQENTARRLLPGVFLGRGGDLKSPSTIHPASGKACIIRGDQCEMLRAIMMDSGWIDFADFRKSEASNETTKALIEHVAPHIGQDDLVLRAGYP